MQHLPVCQQFPETPNGICSQYLMESKHVTLSPSLPHIIQLMVILPGSAKLDFLWLISTISILIVISSWTTGWVSGWSWVSWCFFFYNIYILYIQYTISLCLTILHIYILYINNIPRIYIYIFHICIYADAFDPFPRDILCCFGHHFFQVLILLALPSVALKQSLGISLEVQEAAQPNLNNVGKQ